MNEYDDTPKGEAAWQDRRIWQIQPLRDVFWALLAVFLLYLGYQLQGIFTPVLIALALAYLFQPPINWIEKKLNWKSQWTRPLIISGLLTVVALVLLIAAVFLGGIAVNQSRGLWDSLPEYRDKVQGMIDERLTDEQKENIKQKVWDKIDEVKQDPSQLIQMAGTHVLSGGTVVVETIVAITGTAIYLMVMISLIPIYFFFFAWHFDPMIRSLGKYVPKEHREKTFDIVKKMDRVVATYFRDRVVISVLMSIMFCIGWGLCGVPYWLLLGIATGMLNLIPYASFVGWPLAVLLAYLDDTGSFNVWYVVVWPTVVYLIVQNVEGWILTPWIQGKSTEMSAVTILIVMFVGGSMGGLYGLLLAIPIAACGKILLVEVFLPRLALWAEQN